MVPGLAMSDAEKSAWLDQRCGKLTASRMADAMSFLKNGQSAEVRRKLMYEIMAERATGHAVSHYVSPFMQWGIDKEPIGKGAYEDATGTLLVPCGFYDHPEIQNFGATPDALIGSDAVFEEKCPQTTTHITWSMAGVVPMQHRPQILAQLACTGRTRAVFVSFDPRVMPSKRLFIAEWTPERAEIEAVENAAREFLAEVDAMWEMWTTQEAA